MSPPPTVSYTHLDVYKRQVYVDEGTYDAPNPDGGWFYLEGDGQAAADGWRTINGQRYHFDSDGTMDYGWLNDEDELYYLGDENDGAMKTGWLCLDFDSDEVPDDGQVSMVLNYGDNGTWFYFQTNGQAVKADEDNYVRRTINGYRYYFCLLYTSDTSTTEFRPPMICS